MLFISIYTYEPEHRDIIIKKRTESLMTPEGAKCLGQWSSLAGGKAFTLFEVDHPLVLAQWAQAWNDLGKFEIFPVIDTAELMKAMAAGK